MTHLAVAQEGVAAVLTHAKINVTVLARHAVAVAGALHTTGLGAVDVAFAGNGLNRPEEQLQLQRAHFNAE